MPLETNTQYCAREAIKGADFKMVVVFGTLPFVSGRTESQTSSAINKILFTSTDC